MTDLKNKSEIWRAGYYAEKFGDPYDEDMPEEWKEGYKTSYKDFIENKTGGHIPMGEK